MRKYVAKKDKYTNSESVFIRGKWKTRYFHLYCDNCGARHPDVCVNEFDENDGFGKRDLCWNCQKKEMM